MTILVTGGAGFIGSHLVMRFVEQGRTVRVLDNLSTGKVSNLDPVRDRIKCIQGDISDLAICRQACEGVGIIFHQAAMPSVPKSIAEPVLSHRANIDGTFNLLLAAREAGVKRFVYAASSSAYGESPALPKIETMTPSPLSPYGVQKLAGEHYCTVFARCYGLESIALRYFNVFGPRQDPASQYAAAIPAFITAILEGRSPIVYGDGEQTRDFTYIDNIVHANVLALEARKTDGDAVNVACGEHVTVNEVIRQINAALGKKVKTNHVPERAGDIKHSWADIALAERVLGYRPVVSFAEGLRRTIDWYRKQGGRATVAVGERTGAVD